VIQSRGPGFRFQKRRDAGPLLKKAFLAGSSWFFWSFVFPSFLRRKRFVVEVAQSSFSLILPFCCNIASGFGLGKMSDNIVTAQGLLSHGSAGDVPFGFLENLNIMLSEPPLIARHFAATNLQAKELVSMLASIGCDTDQNTAEAVYEEKDANAHFTVDTKLPEEDKDLLATIRKAVPVSAALVQMAMEQEPPREIFRSFAGRSWMLLSFRIMLPPDHDLVQTLKGLVVELIRGQEVIQTFGVDGLPMRNKDRKILLKEILPATASYSTEGKRSTPLSLMTAYVAPWTKGDPVKILLSAQGDRDSNIPRKQNVFQIMLRLTDPEAAAKGRTQDASMVPCAVTQEFKVLSKFNHQFVKIGGDKRKAAIKDHDKAYGDQRKHAIESFVNTGKFQRPFAPDDFKQYILDEEKKDKRTYGPQFPSSLPSFSMNSTSEQVARAAAQLFLHTSPQDIRSSSSSSASLAPASLSSSSAANSGSKKRERSSPLSLQMPFSGFVPELPAAKILKYDDEMAVDLNKLMQKDRLNVQDMDALRELIQRAWNKLDDSSKMIMSMQLLPDLSKFSQAPFSFIRSPAGHLTSPIMTPSLAEMLSKRSPGGFSQNGP